MGVTNKDNFTRSQNETANLAKALAHPARIAVIEQLLKKEKCICGDLTDELPLAQPTVSQHLKELKNAGLIKGEISGTSVCYCINKEKWEEASEVFNALFASYKGNCC